MQSALDLFVEHGYDQTTVADIAARAGLTERTFFRHFADKREVLFHGGQLLEDGIVEALAGVPPEVAPLAAVATAVSAVAPFFDGRKERSRMRQRVIDSHPELQEREVSKMARLSLVLAAGLRARDVGDTAARLAADAGVAVFRAAFVLWLAGEGEDMGALIGECFDELVKVVEAGR